MSGKSTKTQTSTNTLDPQYSGAVYGNQAAANDLRDNYTPYGGQMVAGFTPTQVEAQSVLGALGRSDVGTGLLNQAAGVAGGAAGYQPINVSAQQVSADKITPQMLADTNLDPYFNPYQQDVIDTSAADINRQRDIALNKARSDALKASAWGGTGAAVYQGQVSDNFDRNLSATIANLRNTGYTNAQDAAKYDITNRLGADQFNSDAALRAALANQGADLSAQQGNQGAGLDANAQRLNASSVLGALSDQQLQQATQRAGILSAVGDAQQQQRQLELSGDYQKYVDELNQRMGLQQGASQATSIIPQTGTQTDTTVTKQSPGIGQILGGLGSLAAGVATGGASFGLTGGLSSILGAAAPAASGAGLASTFGALSRRPMNSILSAG